MFTNTLINQLNMSKKLTLLLITLTALANVSYASFPISDTLEVQQDIVQTEEIKKYHSSLIKMGVDLSSCKCESCREGIEPMTDKGIVKKERKINIWFQILIIMTILAVLLGLLIWRWLENSGAFKGNGLG
jgi:hypothetical protein